MDKYTIVSRAKIRRSWMVEYERLGSVSEVCRRFGISRKTFYVWHRRWISSGKRLDSLYERSRRPKSHPNTTTEDVARKIIELRQKTSYGPRRIAFYLARDCGLKLSPFRIYRVLRRAGLLEKRERRRRRKPREYRVERPGERVQVDVKYLDKIIDERHPEGIREYQYTAIDCATRLRYIEIYEEISAENSVDFVKKALRFFPFGVEVIQTDNGTEFTYELLPHVQVEHPLDTYLRSVGIVHKLIPVGRKEYNGKVERSHRTDEEELYRPKRFADVEARRREARRYLHYYNCERPHSALNYLTPFEYLTKLTHSQGVTYV